MKPLFALASACALLVATPVFACSEAQHFAVIRRFGVRWPGTAGSGARDGRATYPA